MAAVEKIVIEVPLSVAEAYRSATEPERLRIADRIGVMLKFTTGGKQEAISQLKQAMNEIAQEAVSNGLTPEILESILNDT